MKKGLVIIVILFIAFASCKKEYSYEYDSTGIIGTNCRISKIAYADSATANGLGSISAAIDSTNKTTLVTQFDSLASITTFTAPVVYFSDTIAIDGNQYYIFDSTTKRIISFHGLTLPTVVTSPAFDVAYTYNAAGNLISKTYAFTTAPTVPYQKVNYTYTNGNLTHMESDDLVAGDILKNADLTYNTTIAPKNYMYLFPDEVSYAPFNQFFNFGVPSTNAIQNLTVRYFNPGNIVSDSTVSVFSNYKLSTDNYVTSVFMKGDDQSSIPVSAGVLTFSYTCQK